VVFSDVQPEGSKQRNLFQSREESRSKKVHWELDLMEAENVTDDGYSSIDHSWGTKRAVFSDVQPEGSKQRNLFQSREESRSKDVHWELDLMEANRPSQSTLYVKPVVEELAEQYFGVTESTIVLSDSWQCQSTTNAEMRKDRSSTRNGIKKMAGGAIEGQQLTAEEKMEPARANIDKVDWPHRSSRIYGESNIGAGESEMFATRASSDGRLKAALEWEHFNSMPFGSTLTGASFPFDELHAVPSDEV
jgi:hypothetical protein